MPDKLTFYATEVTPGSWYVFPQDARLDDFEPTAIVVWEFDNKSEYNTGSQIRVGDTIADFGLVVNPQTKMADANAYALAYDVAFAMVHCGAYRRGPYTPEVEQTWDVKVDAPTRKQLQELDRDGTLLRVYTNRTQRPITQAAVIAKLEAIKKKRLTETEQSHQAADTEVAATE